MPGDNTPDSADGVNQDILNGWLTGEDDGDEENGGRRLAQMPMRQRPASDANQDIIAGWLATQEAADQEDGGSVDAIWKRVQGGTGQQLQAGRRLA